MKSPWFEGMHAAFIGTCVSKETSERVEAGLVHSVGLPKPLGNWQHFAQLLSTSLQSPDDNS